MVATQPRPWTAAEFLAWEQAQAEKYEFVNGVITMMTGGTSAHATIAGNVFARLREAVRGGPCRAYTSDMKVLADHLAAYPDVSVTCAEVHLRATWLDAPAVIVEVLSASTVDRDYGAKLLAYQAIPSLQHYLLVSQEAWLAEMFSREADGWRQRRYAAADAAIELPAIGARLTLAEIYEGVPLTPP